MVRKECDSVHSNYMRNGLRVLMRIVVPNRTNLATLKFYVIQQVLQLPHITGEFSVVPVIKKVYKTGMTVCA